jgi:hypothetical protein
MTGKRIGFVCVWLLWAGSAEAANRCAPGAVPAGGCTTSHASVQAAITAAASGDTVYLHAGQTYTESITLPNKGTLAADIVITTDGTTGLPGAGVRSGPTYAAVLPKIKSPGSSLPAVLTAPTASNYKFQHIEFPGVPFGYSEIIRLGDGSSVQYLRTQEAHHITLDQVYIHGDPVTGQKRGVSMDGKFLTVTNSYIDDIHSVGQDSQGISGFNSSGEWTITNNYIAAASENILTMGADPGMRTRWTVTGSATTTGAAVQIVEANHNCNEVVSGDPIAVEVSAGNVQIATLTATPSAGTTCTLAWTPALTAAPAVGNRIRFDVVPKNILIRGNHLVKKLSWANGPLAVPTLPVPIASTASGSLAAGTYCYRVQALSTNGYQGQTVYSDLSGEQCLSLSATGNIALDWPDITGETGWRVWRFTASGATSGVYIANASDSYTDDGTGVTVLGTTTFLGTRMQIKNSFEIKGGENITVDRNVMDYSWRGVDNGKQIWLKSVNQDGGCWTCRTINVTLEYNIIGHGCGGLTVQGTATTAGNPSPIPMKDIYFRHNLIYDNQTSSCINGTGVYLLNLYGTTTNLQITHNTAAYDMGGIGATVTMDGAHTGFQFKDNMLPKGAYGIHSPTAFCQAALTTYAPGYSMLGNAIGGLSPTGCPTGNFYPTLTDWQNAFVNYNVSGVNANYALKDTSIFNNAATDGTDVGANIAQLLTYTTGVVQGTSVSPPIITTTSLPNDLISTTYPTTTLTATGGQAPLTWSISAGALPTGLTLSTAGVLSGTATVSGAFSVTVRVTDSTGGTPQTADRAYTFTILAATNITTATLPAGTVQTPYTGGPLTVVGDQSPFVWAVTTGALPTGITLNTTTGVLSGTPTTAATSNFTLSATGALGSFDTQATSITVASEQPVPGRPAVFGTTARVTAGTTLPTTGVRRGDLHVDTSNTDPDVLTAKVGYPASPVWTSATIAALSASDITTGQFRIDEFPGLFPPEVSFATSVTTGLFSGEYIRLEKSACSDLSVTGFLRLCVGADGQLYSSVDGNPYNAVGGYGLSPTGRFGSTTAADTAWVTNNTDRITVDAVGNTILKTVNPGDFEIQVLGAGPTGVSNGYQMGTTTGGSQGRRAQILSLQGSRQQAWLFADTGALTEYFTAFGHSNDTGGSWQRDFGITQEGVVTIRQLQIETNAPPTCNAASRGQLNYLAGGVGVKDTVQICAKDASDVYAYRTLY